MIISKTNDLVFVVVEQAVGEVDDEPLGVRSRDHRA